MSEILEEHLKDILWFSTSFIIGIILLNTVNVIKLEFLNNVSKSIILAIGKYADLSERYECRLTISMPNVPLIDYSILLKGNKYYVIIQGICVSEGEVDYYSFNETYLKPGDKYLIEKLDKKVIFTRK